MATPDLSGLDAEYLDRWPAGGWSLAVLASSSSALVLLVDDARRGHPLLAVCYAVLAVMTAAQWVARWRRPCGVRFTSEGVGIRGVPSLLGRSTWTTLPWDDVVGVEVEPRQAFPSRLVRTSGPSVPLPGLPSLAAGVLEEAVERAQSRVRLRRAS